MRLLLFVFAITCLIGCERKDDLESFYRQWLEKNEAQLLEVERVALSDLTFNKIWTLGETTQFTYHKNGNVTYIDVPLGHDIWRVLPRHKNMLYLVNDTGIFIGVGVDSECMDYHCSISIARPRHGEFSPICADITEYSNGTVCYKHLQNNWYLQYLYFFKNT